VNGVDVAVGLDVLVHILYEADVRHLSTARQ
jgi:hypothetical protein